MRILGVVLIVLGIIMFIISGVSYTTEEKIIDAGPIQVSTEKENDFNWPPYAGGISIAAGIIVLAFSRKK